MINIKYSGIFLSYYFNIFLGLCYSLNFVYSLNYSLSKDFFLGVNQYSCKYKGVLLLTLNTFCLH